MRADRRRPMPDLDLMSRATNALLEKSRLPRCTSLRPVADGDTANPTAVGHAPSRRYAVKAVFAHADTLAAQLRTANWFRHRRGLPIPKHLCHSAPGDPLPLLVMEWMPGDQLRLALPALSADDGRRVARDWGRCLARMHDSQPPPGLIAAGGASWGSDARFSEVLQAAAALCADRAWPPERHSAIQAFLSERRGSFNRAPRGAMKRDSDIRDFLVSPAPTARISAMLDWECAYYGYVLYDCLQAYMKLNAFGRNAFWPFFCAGYEGETGRPLLQDPAAEYCLMCRCIVGNAASNDEIILALAAGRKIPFAERD